MFTLARRRLVQRSIATLRTHTDMAGQFLKRLLGTFCTHRFSWPHNGVHGQSYQVCLICGLAYEYDCTAMRRTGRLAMPVEESKQPSLGKQ